MSVFVRRTNYHILKSTSYSTYADVLKLEMLMIIN